jgi:acetolactate synthase-1/2/3 large subunit
LGDPLKPKQVYPDFIAMAASFNVKAERVVFKRDLRAAMERMLKANEPYVLDVIVPYTEHVMPFIPAGRTVADMMYEK